MLKAGRLADLAGRRERADFTLRRIGVFAGSVHGLSAVMSVCCSGGEVLLRVSRKREEWR